jgi:hypothetical protein
MLLWQTWQGQFDNGLGANGMVGLSSIYRSTQCLETKKILDLYHIVQRMPPNL